MPVDSGGDRYRADRFDGDGEPAQFYVFDVHDHGAQCAGPFDTIEAAIIEQDQLNADHLNTTRGETSP